MFLHYLSETQKRAFFDLADLMVLADKVVAEEEVSYLNRLHWEAGLVERKGPSGEGVDGLLRHFTDHRSQLVLVTELLVLSIVDGVYHTNEDSLVQDVVHRLEMTADEHEKATKVAEHIAHAVVGMWDLVQ